MFGANVPKLKAKKNTAGLRRALRSRHAAVRGDAARALGELSDAEAVDSLAELVRDSDDEVREAAIASLGRLDEPGAGAALVHALAGNEPNTRKRAAIALEATLERSGDRRPARWTAVTTALAASAGVVEWLLAPSDGSDLRLQDLRLAAVRSLEDAADARSVGLLLAVVNDAGLSIGVHDAAVAALGRIGAIAVEPLLTALGDETAPDQPRLAAMAALGTIRDSSAVPPLVAMLEDSNGHLCVGAARALGRIGDPAALGPLLDAVDRRDHDVRIAAITALEGIADPSVLAPLSALLGDDDSEVRQSAVRALAHIGPAAVDPLADAVGNRHLPKDVREAAAQALGEIGDRRATGPLAAALCDERGQVRQAAALALHALGDPRAIEPLAREIDMAIRNLFLSPAKGYRDSLRSLRRLISASEFSDDMWHVVVKASGYGTTWGGFDDNIEYVDLTGSDQAVERLCALESPSTSNVLHLVAAKKDISVTLALCNFSKEESISFQAQRARAEAELARRGNPAYLPTAYMSG